MKPSLVMVCMSRYTEWVAGTVNRNRHMYEACVASGRFEKILLVDFPARNVKRGVRVFLEDLVFARNGKTVSRGMLWRLAQVNRNVWVFTSIEHLFAVKSFFRRLRAVQKFLAIESHLLWSYVPTLPQLFTETDAFLKIFDAVDDWTVHPSYERFRDQLKQNYEIIRTNAHAIFTVSQHLLKLFPNRPRVSWVPNGVDVGHFQLRVRPVEKSRPVIGYVGMLQERFDVDFVEALARARPNYHFLIIGWVWKPLNVAPLRRLSNVELTGFIPYKDIPKFLTTFSVGIVPHKRDGLSRSMNPLKLYDYLAAGLPVVTTEQPDFTDLHGVAQANTVEAFLDAIDHWIAHPPDPVMLRKQVEPFSWGNRLASIIAQLPELGYTAPA